jgi:hypothetical protein
MGVCCSFSCVECGEEAPELGDFGYIGYPSLDAAAGQRDVPNFGHVYAGLAAVRLVTSEVQDFHDFLARHRGHTIDSSGDGEPLFDDGEDLYEEDDEDDDDEEEADDVAAGASADSRYVASQYSATCATCRASFTTKVDYPFLPFDRVSLTAADIKAFLKQVADVADDAMYRAAPVYDGDLENLAAFLRKHAKHEVAVELAPRAKS